jgi:hypothetical protein
MEDRIEAHKLSGMKTAQMLTGLCWSLSRPEILSGPLITRSFLNISDNIISRGSGQNMLSKKQTSRIIKNADTSFLNGGNNQSNNLHLHHHINYLHSIRNTLTSSSQTALTSSSQTALTSNPPSPPITVMQWNVLSQGWQLRFFYLSIDLTLTFSKYKNKSDKISLCFQQQSDCIVIASQHAPRETCLGVHESGR